MEIEPTKGPVRVRTRLRNAGDTQRLVADPAPATAAKRKPNSGSMKKGETRNPNGRPKGAKGTKAMTRKVLQSKTTIRDGGRLRKVSLFQALLLKEVQAAFEGDWRARATVLALGRWALPDEELAPAAASASEQSATDRAVLDWFEAELKAKLAKERDDV